RAVAGGITAVGRSKARVYDLDDRPATRFDDVAGYAGAKQEVTEVVDFLKHPDKYRHAGAVGPRGVLMVGPPGTGKTLRARAVAGEAGVPFLALTGSSFVEMFVGVGAARVRDLFADARKKAPAIIFIDEVDAIGGGSAAGAARGNSAGTTSASSPSTSCWPRWTASTPPPGWCSSPPPTAPKAWTRPSCAPAVSTAPSKSPCPTWPNAGPSWPCT